MIKIAILLLSLLKIGGISVYALHKITKTPQLTVKKLEKPKRELAIGYNKFVDMHPNKQMNELTKQLQWLLENDYKRNPRVRRILHQDLKNLMSMIELKDSLSKSDTDVDKLLNEKITEVVERVKAIRQAKDAAVKEEILLHADLIDDNGKR